MTNLDGVFWTLREACRHMATRAEGGDPGGSVVVTSSTSAIHGAPRNQAYASTKGAVIAMIRGIAVEYARYGVRPGDAKSDGTRGECDHTLRPDCNPGDEDSRSIGSSPAFFGW